MYVRLNFYSCPVNSTRLQIALHVCEDIGPINIVHKVWKVHTRSEPKTSVWCTLDDRHRSDNHGAAIPDYYHILRAIQ